MTIIDGGDPASCNILSKPFTTSAPDLDLSNRAKAILVQTSITVKMNLLLELYLETEVISIKSA